MTRHITSNGKRYGTLVYNPRGLRPGRTDVTDEDAVLQLAVFNQRESGDRIVKAHKHLPQVRETVGTQEVLIVIDGSVTVTFFDEYENEIEDFQLWTGDSVVFLRGAHRVMLAKDSLVYELKNGPYTGVEADKEYIE